MIALIPVVELSGPLNSLLIYLQAVLKLAVYFSKVVVLTLFVDLSGPLNTLFVLVLADSLCSNTIKHTCQPSCFPSCRSNYIYSSTQWAISVR